MYNQFVHVLAGFKAVGWATCSTSGINRVYASLHNMIWTVHANRSCRYGLRSSQIMSLNLHALQALELAKLATELQQLNLPPPHVGETFSFDDAPSALRRFQTGRTVGKVVLQVTDSTQAPVL